MCAEVATAGKIMEVLCCANTHVNCSTAVAEPTLISYDGSHYKLTHEGKASTASTALADADRRLCSMSMADKCADCDRAKCSLFSKAPAPKKCYGKTFVDKPDGSGWAAAATARPASLSAPVPTTLLATFDGVLPIATHRWKEMSDPVMGGKSHGTFKRTLDVNKNYVGEFGGFCAIVPFLKAPGFCKMETETFGKFNDVSASFGGSLQLYVKSTTPDYKGFKVAFTAKGGQRPTPSRHGGSSFKANFVLSSSDWELVKIPFHRFSIDWSEYTGECSTKDPTGEQHHCCTSEHPEVCPTAAHLRDIESLEVWAEGVEGSFGLQVMWIGAGSL
jgi:hypothetical protein